MKICLIIPTLNEKNNVTKIFEKIKKTKIKLDILFIDDNSNDGTKLEISKLKKKFKNVNYIFRYNKSGIGSAHKDGFRYAYKKKYNIIITMDCDGTHDPKYLKNLIHKSKSFDYVITSRFKKRGLIKDWPLTRKLITYLRHIFVKIFLGINYDASGAYRSFLTSKIKLNHLMSAKNNDYAFFWEVTYILKKEGYSIHEIPVKLVFRKLGKSKMKFKHIIYSLYYLFKLSILR